MLEAIYKIVSTPNFIGKPVDKEVRATVNLTADKRNTHWVVNAEDHTDVLETLNSREMSDLLRNGRVQKGFYGLVITISRLDPVGCPHCQAGGHRSPMGVCPCCGDF